MVVILKSEQYLPLLTCGIQAATSYFARYDGPLEASPFPLPPRAPRSDGRVIQPPRPPGDDLFDSAG